MNGTVGYMCSTDFNYELGSAPGGVKIYSSEADLRLHRKCADKCGIIKVVVLFDKVVLQGEMYNHHKK